MAHFVKLNQYNMVIDSIVINNEDMTLDGVESENFGKDFIANKLNLEGKWIQTSYNSSFRKKYAGLGFFYNEEKNEFITLDEKSKWLNPYFSSSNIDNNKKIIIIDGFPRSGNVFLSYLLAKCFPNENVFTGYEYFHNKDLIFKNKEVADISVIAIRNPEDSIKSLIKFREINIEDHNLIFKIALDNLNWFKAIKENKNNLHLVDFNSLKTDLNSVINNLAKSIGTLPIYISEETIFLNMIEDGLQYNIPNEITSNAEIDLSHSLISEVIAEAKIIYEELSNG